MTPKRFFAYVVDRPTCTFVRSHGYFDTLKEATRFARMEAKLWRGPWAVSDTTKPIGKSTVAKGE